MSKFKVNYQIAGAVQKEPLLKISLEDTINKIFDKAKSEIESIRKSETEQTKAAKENKKILEKIKKKIP